MSKFYRLCLVINLSLVIVVHANDIDSNELNSTKSQIKEPEVYISCYDIIKEIELLNKAQDESGKLEGGEKYAAQAVRILALGGMNELIFGDQQKYPKKLLIKEKIKILRLKLDNCSPY